MIWGEGSSFFVLGKEKTETSYAQLKDIQIVNSLELNETQKFIDDFLAKNNLKNEDIDAVILGFSGDSKSDAYYQNTSELFPNSSLLYYKHLSGEFNTASGFSTFIACQIIKNQEIPEVMLINSVKKIALKIFFCIIIWVEMTIAWFC
ncbi:hypothetical protein [Chryseobacterium sp. 3008163]|uniref:hypothetical protein n=1 Tax=Chryseobacterium sp. 3008163 TaxID=2478663 RepID=UPI001E4F05D1|nr:hypothetical protein [Chryseobacterium sp. 3008163]